jgi:uncharacterized protein (DUF1499 family)
MRLEKPLIIVASIALLAILALFAPGYRSHSVEPRGLAEGRLQPCPDTPNCVRSEFVSGAKHYVEPLVYSAGQAARVLPRLKTTIGGLGGSIQGRP